MDKKSVGIVGFGNLGKHLYEFINESPNLRVAFVWNRTASVFDSSLKVPKDLILHHLEDIVLRQPDIIVEVAHPNITHKYGELFLKNADTMLGSPTALADPILKAKLLAACKMHGLYIPSGAFWGGEDIRKMADSNTLKGLTVTMTKHPSSFKLNGHLKDLNDKVSDVAVVLYDGPVRKLCPLAPNNVNTMAAAAVAAHNLGFDKVRGRLIADPGLLDWHEVRVDVIGPLQEDGNHFSVETIRRNPAKPGAVTGSATYASFQSSLNRVGGCGPGFHLC
ncbi:aspartate dehydrogenase domain-containing protein [Lepeophtheirus salmonis]|uniref:aspartate dehydrogenase domain-containing protein n=1 Tax=Lepeophtheirus salmonis TaxID=72036 RepID=UPI001AE5EBB1|nr:putative L-aspartate dehydrogenase [Lepeophtheirus salmonis]